MKIIYLSDKDIAKLNEARSGPVVKDWIVNTTTPVSLIHDG